MWKRWRRTFSSSLANAPRDQPKSNQTDKTLHENQFQSLDFDEHSDSCDSLDDDHSSAPDSPYFNDPLGVNRARRNRHRENGENRTKTVSKQEVETPSSQPTSSSHFSNRVQNRIHSVSSNKLKAPRRGFFFLN